MRDIKIIENMPSNEYHSIKAVSSSNMKKLKNNKLSFIDSMLNPKDADRSDSMILGEAVHCMVLQPELYYDNFVVIPEGVSRATKAGKEFYASLDDSKIKIKQNVHEQAADITSNILAIKSIKEIINHPQSKKELTILWTDVHHNLPCKARVDICIPEKGIFLDIKTTSKGIDANSFAKTIVDYGYDRQIAWYTKALNAAFKRNDFNCSLIAADTSSPYDVEIYIPDESVISIGTELYKSGLQEYKNIATLINTGIITDIKSTLKDKNFKMISMPAWAKDINRR